MRHKKSVSLREIADTPKQVSAPPAQDLQAAAAVYNMGWGKNYRNISGNPAKIDNGTTWGDYGSDILLLMNCF